MTIDELIDASVSAALENGSWVGSAEHLGLLQQFVGDLPGLEDVTVRWGSVGTPSSWQHVGALISVEWPAVSARAAAEERAVVAALSVFHESLHARLSTPAPGFRQMLEAMDHRLQPATKVLFNLIEDGRMHLLAVAADDSVASAVRDLTARSIEQLDQRSGASGFGPSPASASNQLIFGLMVYALDPTRRCELHAAVAEKLAELVPLIDSTRAGATEGCGTAAISLVAEASAFRLPT